MNLFSFLKPLGSLLRKAFGLAVDAGLTNDLVDVALKWARVAEGKFVDNDKRRAFVLKMLVTKAKVPESVARLCVELAVRLIKKELAQLDEKY